MEGGIDNNDWAAAAATGRVPAAGQACGQWRRWEEDFRLLKALGHNAHRLSLEWSRIEPLPGEWDEAALSHYHDELLWLRENKITTFATLQHFTLPAWAARQGGWANQKTVEDFARFTAKVCQAFGHLVDFWLTINEPAIAAGMGYVRGQWPPFQKNIFRAFQVYRRLLTAHNRAYEVIHAYYPAARVGFAQNIALFERWAGFMNWLHVTYPFGRTRNDFLGVNHYFYHGKNPAPRTDRGWPIYPPALRQTLLNLKHFHLPIYITENGLADADDGQRRDYIRGYLGAVWEAIAGGADVRGYLHWSLLDNFEWEDGYRWRFGLVEVDFATGRRKIRASALYYAEICRTNTLFLDS